MRRQNFESREAASAAASEVLSAALSTALSARPEANQLSTLIVSGGTTPKLALEQLSLKTLEWSRVNVVLSDERVVPPDHPDSNTRMIHETLLRNEAEKSRLIDLESTALARLATPYAAALVGMGEDGHFASIFPDADNLSEVLDPANSALCVPIQTSASPHPRVTLTLATLLNSTEIIVLCFGNRKKEILATANRYPVGKLLTAPQVRVFWAP